MRFFKLCVTLSLLLGTVGTVEGQNSGSHRVTVRVLRGNEIAVAGGETAQENRDHRLGLKSGPKALQSLNWTVQPSVKKMTVSYDGLFSRTQVRFTVTDCQGCTSAGPITMTHTPQEFIRDVGQTEGNCCLEYSIADDLADSTQSSIPTVFYTITDIN